MRAPNLTTVLKMRSDEAFIQRQNYVFGSVDEISFDLVKLSFLTGQMSFRIRHFSPALCSMPSAFSRWSDECTELVPNFSASINFQFGD